MATERTEQRTRSFFAGRAISLALLLFAFPALPLFAQRTEDAQKKKADYSREALLEIFVATPDVVPERGPFDSGIVFERGPVRYRFMPIVAPFVVGGLGGSMNTTPMPTVDPFALTGLSMPYDSGSWENSWETWRIRRMLRKNIESANRRDNQK